MKNEKEIRKLKSLKKILKLTVAYALMTGIILGEYNIIKNELEENEVEKTAMLKTNYDDYGKDKVKQKTKKK